jgi:hypothetical protein
MRPSFHCRSGTFSSRKITMDPTFNGRRFVFCHLFRGCNWFKYSVDQRLQNSWRNFSTRCHLVSLLSGTSPRLYSAGAIRAVPIKKCPGVNGCKSLGSSLRGVRGRELRQASIKRNPTKMLPRLAGARVTGIVPGRRS